MRKLLILFGAAALCCGMTGAGAAAPPTQAWNPDDTAPTREDVASAAAQARAIHCTTPSCKAIMIINDLVDIVRFEDGDANGLASLDLGDRPRIAGRRLDRVLLSQPNLYRPVCATGAKLISRFRADGPGVHEWWVPIELLIHGVDMDLRDQGHCAQDLLAALPQDPANDVVRRNANTLCVNGDEDHLRPKAACDVLIQGLAPGQ